MTHREATSAFREVGGGPYGHVYCGADLVDERAFPFRPGDETRVRIVAHPTLATDPDAVRSAAALIVTPAALAVDGDATDLVLEAAPGFEGQVDPAPDQARLDAMTDTVARDGGPGVTRRD